MRRTSRALRPEACGARLRELLIAADVDLVSPRSVDLDGALDAMVRFAAEPVVGASDGPDGDLLLVQHGTFDWGDGPRFEVDLTRQLRFVDRRGEHDHFMQVSCTFRWLPTSELVAVGSASLWSEGVPLQTFVRESRALPGLEVVRERGVEPTSVSVSAERA